MVARAGSGDWRIGLGGGAGGGAAGGSGGTGSGAGAGSGGAGRAGGAASERATGSGSITGRTGAGAAGAGLLGRGVGRGSGAVGALTGADGASSTIRALTVRGGGSELRDQLNTSARPRMAPLMNNAWTSSDPSAATAILTAVRGRVGRKDAAVMRGAPMGTMRCAMRVALQHSSLQSASY